MVSLECTIDRVWRRDVLSSAYAHAAHLPVRGHIVAAVTRHVAHVAVVHVGMIHCLGLGVAVGRLIESQKGQGWR